MLGHIQSESNQWRIRKLIASQLKDCVELFEPKVIYKIHVPIALKLCKDDVAEVRLKAWCNVPVILQNLYKETNKEYFSKVIHEISKFGESNRYILRQVYITIWHNVLWEDLIMFYTYFMKKFIELQNDRVTNVRIILSKSWGTFLSNFIDAENPEDSDKSEQVEEEKEQHIESNVQKNRIYYARILIDDKFMKMINKLREDDIEDVKNQISDNVNFEKLLIFIHDNQKQIEEIKMPNENNDIELTKQEVESNQNEETRDNEEDFSLNNPNPSVGMWSLFSAREIIDDVINSSEDEVDEDVDQE